MQDLFLNAALMTTDAQSVQQDGITSILMSVGMVIIVVGFMYFMVIRPQRKRDKELKDQMSKMTVGDTIITIGGIMGVLASSDDDSVTIYSSVANTPIKLQKAAIQTVIPRDSKKEEK